MFNRKSIYALNIYAHLDFTAQEESANAMSGMFSREPKEVQPA